MKLLHDRFATIWLSHAIQHSPLARRRYFHGSNLTSRIVMSIGLLFGITAIPAFASGAVTQVDPNQFGISGAWYNPASTGQGLVISVMPNVDGAGHSGYFGGWFTYADKWSGQWYGQALGTPMWLTLQGTTVTYTPEYGMSLQIFDNDGRLGQFDALPVVPSTMLGIAIISLSDCNHLHLHYTDEYRDDWIDPQWSDMDLVRLMPNVSCNETLPVSSPTPSAFGYSGAWYDPSTSGQGFAFEVNPLLGATASGGGTIFGGWFTYARASISPTNKGRRWYTLQGAYSGLPGDPSMTSPISGDLGIYATTGGSFGAFNSPATVISTTQVGTATVIFASCSTASVKYSFYAGENAGLTNTIQLQRLGPVPADCAQ